MPVRIALSIGLFLATVVSLACEGVAAPAASTAGTDVDRAVEKARSIEGLESFAVWRDGDFLIEEYFRGGPRELRDIRSGTKSITSLLVGIAVDRGLIESIDRTLGELVPDLVARYGTEKRSIRLRDLLTMTAGIDWGEETADKYNAWVVSRDPVDFYLGRKMAAAPGETFAYSSGASQILGEVVSRVSGTSLAEFGRTYLFEPMGIEAVRWHRLRNGSYNSASGFQIRTRDLVRVGRLVLDNGLWEGRRVVSREWIEASMRAWVPAIEEGDYGLHWWIPKLVPKRSILALGHAGQVLFIVPETRTVAVATSRLSGFARGAASEQGSQVMRFLLVSPEMQPVLFGDPNPAE